MDVARGATKMGPVRYCVCVCVDTRTYIPVLSHTCARSHSHSNTHTRTQACVMHICVYVRVQYPGSFLLLLRLHMTNPNALDGFDGQVFQVAISSGSRKRGQYRSTPWHREAPRSLLVPQQLRHPSVSWVGWGERELQQMTVFVD